MEQKKKPLEFRLKIPRAYFPDGGGVTLEALAAKVYKSKATISKYEKGEIKLDLETLYDIADALHVHVDQLLVSRSAEEETEGHEVDPAFFRGLNRFYAYFYDGRDQKINRSVCDILSQTDVNQYKLILYMNCKDLENISIAKMSIPAISSISMRFPLSKWCIRRTPWSTAAFRSWQHSWIPRSNGDCGTESPQGL